MLQWNVWVKEKADNIIDFIRQVDADVVCLQELTADSFVNPGRNLPEEIGSLGYHTAFFAAHKRTGEEHIQMGNGIFSKAPLTGSRTVFVQHEDPESRDYSRENRAYLETTLQLGAERLTVGTVHLSYTDGFAPTPEKQAETDKLLAAIAPNKERFVLTGDMNALADSYTIQHLDEQLAAAGPDYNEASWTTKPFTYGGFSADTLAWRIDYVFTSRDLNVVSSQLLPTDYSDHLPILTTIEL
jgi:endonuclease/exonuclease/phosphatase family metal-dependent hydrolase